MTLLRANEGFVISWAYFPLEESKPRGIFCWWPLFIAGPTPDPIKIESCVGKKEGDVCKVCKKDTLYCTGKCKNKVCDGHEIPSKSISNYWHEHRCCNQAPYSDQLMLFLYFQRGLPRYIIHFVHGCLCLSPAWLCNKFLGFWLVQRGHPCEFIYFDNIRSRENVPLSAN